MIETAPAHLTFADYITRELSESENTIEWLAAKIGLENANILKTVIGGTMRAPASLLFPIAKALEIDPAHVLNVYLRDYLPEIEQALFDCEGMMSLTRRERVLVQKYRQCADDKDPEMVVFENKRMVAFAIT